MSAAWGFRWNLGSLNSPALLALLPVAILVSLFECPSVYSVLGLMSHGSGISDHQRAPLKHKLDLHGFMNWPLRTTLQVSRLTHCLGLPALWIHGASLCDCSGLPSYTFPPSVQSDTPKFGLPAQAR